MKIKPFINKTPCILLIIFFIILSGCNSEPKESKKVSSSAAENIIVYITKTGECYHDEGCSSLRKSKKEITLDRATRNYRACQNCYPHVIEK